MDSYFEKQDKPTVFLVLGKEVIVDNICGDGGVLTLIKPHIIIKETKKNI